MSKISSSLLVCSTTSVLALLVLLSAAATPAAAFQTFECHRVWGAPSAANSITSCLLNVTHLASIFNTADERARIGGVLIPLAVVFVVVLVYPIFLSLRYCVDFCGSYKRRPGYLCYGGEEWDDVSEEVKNRVYDPSSANFTRGLAYVCLFASFVPLVLLLVGTGDIQTAYNTLFDEIFQIVGWAEAKERSIRTSVSDSSGTLYAPLNSTFFDYVRTAVAGYKADIQTANNANAALIDIIKIVSIIFSILPTLSLLANALFAAFDIRHCWPLVNSFVHFIFLCFYAVIASGTLLTGVLSDRICGERDAFLAGQASMASYWMVPKCEKIEALGQVRETLVGATHVSSVAACQKLTTHCENAAAYDGAPNVGVIFYCSAALITTPTTQCTTSAEVKTIFTDASLVAQTGGASCGTAPCNLKNCKDTCVSGTHKTIASDILLAQTKATGIQNAENIFTKDLGNCSAIVHRALNSLKSCNDIKTSVFFVGVGSCIYTGLFLIGLFVIFRGQKRFFKPIHIKPEEKKKKTLSPGTSPGSPSLEPIENDKASKYRA